MQTYTWNSNRSHPKVDANLVGRTIESIVERDGLCAPSSLVEEAKPEDSPLHSLFTWDDTEAATNWRTHEARGVINAIAIHIQTEKGEVEAPAFVSVGRVKDNAEHGAGYRPLSVVIADRDFRAEALQTALSELNAMRRRYQALKQLDPVWEALELVAA